MFSNTETSILIDSRATPTIIRLLLLVVVDPLLHLELEQVEAEAEVQQSPHNREPKQTDRFR